MTDTRITIYLGMAILAGIFAAMGYIKGDLGDSLIQTALVASSLLAAIMTKRQKKILEPREPE